MKRITLPSFLYSQSSIDANKEDRNSRCTKCQTSCEPHSQCGTCQYCQSTCQTNCNGSTMSCTQSSPKPDPPKPDPPKPTPPKPTPPKPGGSSSSGSSSSSSSSSSNSSSSNSSSSSSGSSSSSRPSSSSNPPNISQVDPDKVSSGNVIINNADGTQTVIKDVPLYNGAFYDPVTGNILGDTHGPDGVYDKDKFDKDAYRDEDGTMTGVFTEKPQGCQTSCESSCQSGCQKSSQGSGGCSSSCERSCQSNCQKNSQGCSGCQSSCERSVQCGSCQIMSQQPPKVEWNEPFPVFNAKLKKVYRYTYHLGVDEAIFSSVTYEENSACVTPLIEIGALKEEEFLMLEADFSGSVEFYIIDGAKEIPILPVEQTLIENEKMFYGLPLRFIPDDQYEVKVKRNDVTIGDTYDKIINDSKYWDNNNKYSATYVPIPQNTYKPNEQYIQIKAIIRGIGSVKRMSLRHYGENYYID